MPRGVAVSLFFCAHTGKKINPPSGFLIHIGLSPARTCIEKPTWGHCTWATGTNPDQGRMEGLFTWADDTCPHFVMRRQSLLRR